MKPSGKGARSLRDGLLEYVVLNFDQLLPPRPEKREKPCAGGILRLLAATPPLRALQRTKRRPAFPEFPSHLFADVLTKSEDMCWRIRARDLKRCLPFRDRLGWREASCLRLVGSELSTDDLKQFAGSMGALKSVTVSVRVHSKGKNAFDRISKAAAGLEDLTVHMLDGFDENPMDAKPSGKRTALPELRVLRVDLNYNSFEWIPYDLDPAKLTVLDVRQIDLTKIFLETLAGFKGLVRLSLIGMIVRQVSGPELMDVVVGLKRLRLLSLYGFVFPLDEAGLNRILEELEDLELLELDSMIIEDPARLIKPKKKLKVLNCFLFGESVLDVPTSELAAIASRVGNVHELSALLTVISTTPTPYIYDTAVKTLYNLVRIGQLSFKRLAREERDRQFIFRSPLRLNEAFDWDGRFVQPSYKLIVRLMCHGLREYGLNRFPFLKTWMSHYVKHNGSTHLANALRRWYLTSPESTLEGQAL